MACYMEEVVGGRVSNAGGLWRVHQPGAGGRRAGEFLILDDYFFKNV